MTMRSIEDLERGLREHDEADRLGPPDLSRIRTVGRRRRWARRLVGTGGGLLAAGAVAGVVIGVTAGSDSPEAADRSTAASDHSAAPKKLTPLAKRVLAEVPGARQVSPGQVVIPAPAGSTPPVGSQKLPASRFGDRAYELPAHVYTGVTGFEEGAFPSWLYDGVLAAEAKLGEPASDGEAASVPVGSTEMGILVDRGPGELGCTTWPDEELPKGLDGCVPSLLSRSGDDRFLEWSMGTDDFLKDGAPMEVFLSDDYSSGEPSTLAIAGLAGTDVARVEFLPVDGGPVSGEIASGTLSKGDSMFFANVPGDLARVVAYDAEGSVIEDHKLRDCADPVDCEVR